MDESSVQLTWRASPAEGLELRVGDQVVRPCASSPAPLVLTVTGDEGRHWRRRLDPLWPGGPGAATVTGLAPGTSYEVVASATGGRPFKVGTATTLLPPHGELTACFATVSDIHIGEQRFGIMGRIHDPYWRDGPFPQRALEAALAEARAFGASMVVVKGDLTREASAAEVRDAGKLLAASPLPIVTMLGNHDNNRRVNQVAILEAQGVRATLRPQVLDLAHLRLVAANSMHPGWHYHRGHLPAEAREEILEAVGNAPGPVWLALHHPPDLRGYPTAYPPGIPRSESVPLLDEIISANPRTFLTAGHRHRNRCYKYGPIAISEVGSTKDYPGVWAGYRVYEGGIVQTVRRISRPDVMAWTEATRRALNGQWGLWSQGSPAQRCLSWTWPQT